MRVDQVEGFVLVTTVVMVLVLGLSAWVGVQVMTPLGLMTTPAGGLTREYPTVEWMLASAAVLVTVNKASSLTVCGAMTGRTGATLTSLTTTVKLLVALNCGLTGSYGFVLVTTVVMMLVLGLSAWVGVQVMNRWG